MNIQRVSIAIFHLQLHMWHPCHSETGGPVDSGDTLCFHCAFRTILAGSFCCLLKDERTDANLAIELMFGMAILVDELGDRRR